MIISIIKYIKHRHRFVPLYNLKNTKVFTPIVEGTTPKPFKTSQRVTKTPVKVTQKATFPTPNYPDSKYLLPAS